MVLDIGRADSSSKYILTQCASLVLDKAYFTSMPSLFILSNFPEVISIY